MIKSLSYLLGLLITLELFKFRVLGFTVYPHDLIFLALTIFLAFVSIKNTSFRNSSLLKSNVTWLVLLFFSTFYISAFALYGPLANQGYLFSGIKFLIKFALIFVFLIIFSVAAPTLRDKVCHFVVQGFIHSILIHALFSWWFLFDWYNNHGSGFASVMQAFNISDESVGHPLINYIFRPYVRTAGLHWDPAYFGLWGAIFLAWMAGFSNYSLLRKVFLFIVVVPVWVLTISKSAFAALVLSMVAIFVLLPRWTFLKLYVRYTIASLVLVTIGLSGLIYSTTFSVGDLVKAVQLRASVSGDGNNRHLMTPIIAFEAITHSPQKFLFGYGPRSSGQAMYFSSMEVPGKPKSEIKNATYDVESDWGKTIASQGIIGFILYVLAFNVLIISLARRVRQNGGQTESFLLCACTLSFMAGFFYIYLDSRWLFLLLVLSLNFVSDEKSKVLDHAR